MIALYPLIIAIVGLLMYALCASSKLQEIGKWVFIIGFFFLVSGLAGKSVSFLK